MKKLAIIAFGLMAILSTESCNKDKCLKGNTYRIGSHRNLEPFTAITVNLSAIVEIIPDTVAPYIEFVVEGNLEQYVATEIADSVLTISLSDCFKEHQDILMRIHFDTLNTITINGPGDVLSRGILVQDSINLQIESTGSISLTTDIQKVNTSINGTGNVLINGQIGLHNITHNNAGAINTYQAVTQDAVIYSTGSGNTYIRVKNTINGTLNNSGSLYYKGQTSVSVTENSSGKVVDDN